MSAMGTACVQGYIRYLAAKLVMNKQGDSPDHEYWWQLQKCQQHVVPDFYL